MGRVNKLARVGHKQHSKYVERLKRVRPLPSGNEDQFCEKKLVRLETIYEKDAAKLSYRRNFYRLQERLSILNRSFPRVASALKDRLRVISPAEKER